MTRRRIIDLDAPDRFVALKSSAAGEEGLSLQAIRGSRTVTVALEREQLALLADRLFVILDELERRGLVAIDAAPGANDEPPLEGPPREAFRAGALTIAWDDDGDRLIIEALSMLFEAGAGERAPPLSEETDADEVPDDDPIGPDVLRVRLTPVMAQRFARQARQLSAEAPRTCPTCGRPMVPGAQRCPGGHAVLDAEGRQG